MPITEPDIRIIDGVQYRNHTKPVRRLGDSWLAWRPDTYGQDAEINAHHDLTRVKDRVGIIGGGPGISTIHAAWQVGEDGSVTVFEGGNIASMIREVAQINHVDDMVQVVEAIVGEATTLYQGMADNVQLIDPAELPDFDVVEMDCEGSELGILRDLEIRPRVLIVELHPGLYDGPNEKPLTLIEEMGYEIAYFTTQLGDRMSPETFKQRLAKGCGDVVVGVMPS
jgi:hypothetical protein